MTVGPERRASRHGDAPCKRGNVAPAGKARAYQQHSLRHEHRNLIGFVVMGLTLTLNRMGQTGKALSIGLMAAGTGLVFLGLYAGGWSG
jgi:hypothetical protein